MRASTSGSSGGKRADRDYFQAAMAGKFFISAPSTSQQTGKTAIFIAIPVRDADGSRIIGVLMAAVQVEELSKRYVAPVTLLRQGYAMVVNAQGKFMGHKDEKAIAGKGLPYPGRQVSGDLLVEIKVRTPTRLNSRQEEILREFAEIDVQKPINKAKKIMKKVGKAMGID